MKAVAVTNFGGPEVVQIIDIPEPTLESEYTLVRVLAAGVNPTDTLFREGRIAYPLEVPKPPYVLGTELVGTVAVADPASQLQHGDRVIALTRAGTHWGGAQAEMVAVPTESLVPVVTSLPNDQAATLPLNTLTARKAVDLIDAQPGGVVAVTGAGGAVGGYAVELASHAGLRVVADANEHARLRIQELGANIVVERGPTSPERFSMPSPLGWMR